MEDSTNHNHIREFTAIMHQLTEFVERPDLTEYISWVCWRIQNIQDFFHAEPKTDLGKIINNFEALYCARNLYATGLDEAYKAWNEVEDRDLSDTDDLVEFCTMPNYFHKPALCFDLTSLETHIEKHYDLKQP